MKNIGEVLKIARLGSKMTQEQMAKGILSKVHYSRIENNKYQVSYEILEKLLKKLHMSFDEFHYIMNDYKETNKNQLSDQIYEAWSKSDYIKLGQLEKQSFKKFKETNEFFYEHCTYLCESLRLKKDKSKINKNHIKKIEQYLSEKNNYTFYDFKLLANFYDIFEPEITFLLADTVLEHYKKYDSFRRKEDDVAFFLLNLIDLAIKTNNFIKANIYLKIMRKRIKNDHNLIIKNGYKFNNGLYLIKSGKDIQLGLSETKKAIQIFEDLDCNSLVKIFQDDLDNTLKQLKKA